MAKSRELYRDIRDKMPVSREVLVRLCNHARFLRSKGSVVAEVTTLPWACFTPKKKPQGA